jgi:hypothetical protein
MHGVVRCRALALERRQRQMNIATVIAVIAIAAILFFAAHYLYKEKKKGNHCVGCPYAGSCTKYKNNQNCS